MLALHLSEYQSLPGKEPKMTLRNGLWCTSTVTAVKWTWE